MLPFYVLAGTGFALYALLKPHPTRSNPFPDGKFPPPVPVPVPPPSANPPAGMLVPQGIDLVADLTNAVPGVAGQEVPATWEYTSGTFAGNGGGGTLPLAWIAPDKTKAAVVWNVDDRYGFSDVFKVGAIYAARPMQELDVPFFANAWNGPAAQGAVSTGIINPAPAV